MLLCLSRLLCITIYVQLFQLLCVSRAARHHIYVCFNSIVSIFVVNPHVSSIASSVFIRSVASIARPFTTRVSRAPPAAPICHHYCGPSQPLIPLRSQALIACTLR